MTPSRGDALQGRTALVTGAFRGPGLHFARTLAAHGATVALAGRRIQLGLTLAAEIGEAGSRPGEIRAYAMDGTDAASIAGAMERIVAELGAPRIVVNNAVEPRWKRTDHTGRAFERRRQRLATCT